jgi:hypothetical protein
MIEQQIEAGKAWFGAMGAVLIFSAGCQAPPADAGATEGDPDPARVERVRTLLSALAADSMEGRLTGSEGIRKAGRLIAAELESYGIEPAGDDGFLQTVPLRRIPPNPDAAGSRGALRPLPDMAAFDSVPPEQQVRDANVVGIIRGSDPVLSAEAVIVGAHYDHVGIGAPVEDSVFDATGAFVGMEMDSIYNGADDDASGVVAVLEVARALAAGDPPQRTIVFVLSTGEERGLIGTNYYIAHPVIPMEQTVADLQIEMIGRPDSLAGGVGGAWLTGYERSTMGDFLASTGSRIVPDQRLEQNFFGRSDNIAFAVLGIPAHTVSSFNLHDEYHTPKDEVRHVDFVHMSTVIESTIDMVRAIASGPRPEWHPGGAPEPRGGRGGGGGAGGAGAASGR